MIKIIDDWYVTVETNPTNYIVRRGSGEKDKRQGWKDKPIGFFGSLRNAVKFIRGQIIAEGLKPDFRTLAEAVQMVSEVDDRFEEIMERVTA